MRLPLIAILALATPAAAGTWPGWGGPLVGNQREAVGETRISPATAPNLHTKWSFAANGNITATPTVESNAVYFTDDWGGVYRLNSSTGQPVWMHWMSDYTGSSASNSRSSPAIAGTLLILADRRSGAVVGVNKATGSLVWSTKVETNPYVTLTASPVVYNGTVFVGTSSNEEYQVSVMSSYVPSFRGSVAALDAATGKLLWQTSMVPAGYTGGAVWGSGFPVLPSLNLLYVATGNNYTLPQTASNCIAAVATRAAQLACLSPADHVDSVVALDIATGTVRWARRLQGLDTFNLNCTSQTPAQPCPTPTGRDYDFASAPNILAATSNGTTTTLVGAGQKSGAYWALKPDTGAIAWSSHPGPGGVRGGILWGSAVDATHVYVAENDANGVPYKQAGTGARLTAGSWAAINAATGAIAWQTPAPGGSGAGGSMTVANGVVFGGDVAGDMVALDSTTGALLWRFQAGASVTCGPAVADGVIYWGSGDPYGKRATTLYAFAP